MTVSCPCGATWTGTTIQHCTARGCHQSFAGTRIGDAHRVGPHGTPERRCLTVDEMTAKGWRQVPLSSTGHLVWRGKALTAEEKTRLKTQDPPPSTHAHEFEGLPAPDGTIHTPGIPTT